MHNVLLFTVDLHYSCKGRGGLGNFDSFCKLAQKKKHLTFPRITKDEAPGVVEEDPADI